MPINPPRKVIKQERVEQFAKGNQSILWFIGGLLLGYAFGAIPV